MRLQAINCMLNGKDVLISLKGGQIKKDIVQISEYFPKSKSSGGRVKVELDLSNYATKVDLKNARGVNTLSFAKKMIQLILNLMQINQIVIN